MNTKSIVSFLSYSTYFIGVIVFSYAMQWVTLLFIGSMRFDAADSYPGDLGRNALITWSVVFPVMHFVFLTMYLGFQNLLMSLLNIKFQNRIPFIFNIAITLCLIGYFLFVYLVLDKSLLS